MLTYRPMHFPSNCWLWIFWKFPSLLPVLLDGQFDLLEDVLQTFSSDATGGLEAERLAPPCFINTELAGYFLQGDGAGKILFVCDHNYGNTQLLRQLYNALQLQLGLVESLGVRAVKDEEYEVGVAGVTPPQRSGPLQPPNVPQVEHSARSLNLKIKDNNQYYCWSGNAMLRTLHPVQCMQCSAVESLYLTFWQLKPMVGWVLV